MTLTTEPTVPDRSDDLLEEKTVVLQEPTEKPAARVRWFEWAIGMVAVAALFVSIVALLGQEEVPEMTLILGPRHDGVVFVPEYVGRSGGDLPAFESSPLVFGARHIDGFVYLPVYIGYADGPHDEDTR